MILTIDFGTSVTKVGLWGDAGLVALARSELTTTHPEVGWAEQDPLRWWTTLVIACAEARAQAPQAFNEVDVVACSGARQTFVPMTSRGEPVGKGILWSDHRAAAEARALAERMGGDDINRARTGIPLDAGAVAAKLAWLAENEPARLEAADLILSPRDFIVLRMTDQVVTDATFASRSGLYDFDGNAVRELAGPALGKLPSVVPSDTVVGQLKSVPAAELGLRPGIPVVIGAGDRQCEVLGSGSSEDHPMVSWGTTGNVSVPVQDRPVPSPAGAVVHAGRRQRLAPRRRTVGRRFVPRPGWGGCSTAPTTSWPAWPARARRVHGAWSPCRGSTVLVRRGGATTPGRGSWAWARRTAPATWPAR